MNKEEKNSRRKMVKTIVAGAAAMGTGVVAQNITANGTSAGFGLNARTNHTGGTAVAASMRAATFFAGTAVSGFVDAGVTGGIGVIGDADNATGRGVQGQADGASGMGVFAISNSTTTGHALVVQGNKNVSGTPAIEDHIAQIFNANGGSSVDVLAVINNNLTQYSYVY